MQVLVIIAKARSFPQRHVHVPVLFNRSSSFQLAVLKSRALRAWFPKQTLPPKLSSSDFRSPPFLTIYVYADFVLWTCSNFCRLFRYWRKIRNFFTDMNYCETTSFHINTDFKARRYTKWGKTFSCNVTWISIVTSVAAFPFWRKAAKITEP
jgi:hypothetical protein